MARSVQTGTGLGTVPVAPKPINPCVGRNSRSGVGLDSATVRARMVQRLVPPASATLPYCMPW